MAGRYGPRPMYKGKLTKWALENKEEATEMLKAKGFKVKDIVLMFKEALIAAKAT